MSHFFCRRPDDWHLHLRDGDMLRAVAGHSSANFARAIIMPNLAPPIASCAAAAAYRARIGAAIPGDHIFEPLMTLYLTETLTADEVAQGAQSGLIAAVKLYPAGATTHSEAGIRDIDTVIPVLERIAELGIPLLVHGEVTNSEIDIFDREAVFIETVLDPMRRRVPGLRVVLEHVTTAEGVEYVLSAGGDIAATITVHHLILNRNSYLSGGIRPHYYCLPVAKRETHRRALCAAVTSGNPKFFLGTDSAPHPDTAKQSACGCAGIFSAINALNCLAQLFENAGAIAHFEAFASVNGARFYQRPLNETRLEFYKSDEPLDFPAKITLPGDTITVFDPGFPLYWRHRIADGAYADTG